MKFPKFRNSGRIIKIQIILLFSFFGFHSLKGQTNQKQIDETQTNIPAKTNTSKNNTGTIGTSSQNTQVNTTNNSKNPLNRIPPVNKNEARSSLISDDDQAAILSEDSIRLVREAEIEADANKAALRKRIFGTSLFNNYKFDPNASINIPTPSNYVLGANDQLILDVYGYSQFHEEVTINPDGNVTITKAGVVKIGGLTINEAEDKIKTAMSRIFLGLKSFDGYPANTFLKVSLGGLRSIKVNITGEVVAPGTYTLTSFTTALNALYACGGPNEIGTFRNIKVIRNNRVVTTLDLYEVLVSGYTKSNILLKDQDIIQVGTYISRIALNGQLKRPGLFELTENETLKNALNYSGGFDQYAYTHRLKIYRNTLKERKIVDIQKKDFEIARMYSGDSVVVERLLDRYENMVSIEGAVFRPGEYSLESNSTISDLLKSSDGLKGDALVGRIRIVRTNDDLSVENISLNWEDIKNGKSSDFPLKREDYIFIPSIFDLTELSTIKIQGSINNEFAEAGVELPYIKNMTIEDVLVKVGGLTEAAALSKIEVVRRNRNIDPTKSNAQISEIHEFTIRQDLKVDERISNFILLPFDEIFVRSSPNYEKQTFANIEGEVLYPGRYGIKNKEEKISDLITRSGGLTIQSYIKGATLLRTVKLSEYELDQRNKTISDISESGTAKTNIEVEDLETNKVESIGINLTKILENPGSIEDMILQDGDIIKIPKRLETVRIQGEVLYPTTVKFLPTNKFLDYISKSGGFTKRSLKNKTYVLYPNGSVDRTRRFLFTNIYPKIEPGSEIIVPQKAQNTAQQLAAFQGAIGSVASTITVLVSILGILRFTN